jgi:hypothetical protein
MEIREKTFNVRFSLGASIPQALWDDEQFEGDEWLQEWEVAIKPGLVRAIFAHLRSFPNWEAHVRNRGMSPLDEIEIVFQRTFSVVAPGSDTTVQ